MKKFFSSSPGLTLLETTIALGILMLGILASLTLMLSSFNYIQSSEDEIVVVNLAREGLEIVRSVRNNNSNPPSGETDVVDIFTGTFDNKSYLVDSGDNSTLGISNQVANISAGDINQCNAGDNAPCRLYLTSSGRYTHDYTAGEPTTFSRLVTIFSSPDGYSYEKKIVSTVSWQVKGRTHVLSLETRLTDWQKSAN
ncbi:MAG TPA: hypothetical protein PLR18_02750 [bacterium]|nr:hypothetical protein [bacterium]